MTGELLGMPIGALVGGLAGGLVAILALRPPEQEKPQPGGLGLALALAATLVVSVLTAGMLGPLTAGLLHVDKVAAAVELHAYSFLWGAGAQAGLLVAAINALRNRINQVGGGA